MESLSLKNEFHNQTSCVVQSKVNDVVTEIQLVNYVLGFKLHVNMLKG